MTKRLLHDIGTSIHTREKHDLSAAIHEWEMAASGAPNSSTIAPQDAAQRGRISA